MEKKGENAPAVLNALQDIGNELWTSTQGKIGRNKEKTLMYSGDTNKDTTRQLTDTCKVKALCY